MRDETGRFLIGISLIAALVIGLFFWSRSQPASTAPLPPSEPVQEVAQAPVPRPMPHVEPAPIASTPAPSTAPRVSPLAATPAAREAGPTQTATERIPFPRDLPRAFTASGFHHELVRVVAECKFPYQVTEEDCSEFPCIAWGTWKGDNISPDTCPAWHDTFGSKDFIFAHKDAEGNPLAGIAAFPPDFKFGGDELRHLKGRADGMMQTHREPRQPHHSTELTKPAPATRQLARK